MTGFTLAAATLAFGDEVWKDCGVVVRESAMSVNRPNWLELQTWQMTSIEQNGPRSWLATRDDGLQISIVREGCGCRG